MANGLFNLKQVVQAVQQGGWPAQKTPAVEYLVVAGGGGGGNGGGGGGAGGLIQGIDPVPNGQTLLVTVGGGGAGSTAAGTVGTSGQNSVFGAITSTGGGGGGTFNSGAATGNSGLSGGSGGGGAAAYTGIVTGSAGQGTSGQGNVGGISNGSVGQPYAGAGGGGAGTQGLNGIGSNGPAGNGGAGISSAISGTVTAYAGGGGGGAAGSAVTTSSTGGVGGGGSLSGAYGSTGGNGTANTGGGAAAGWGGNGGTGGSGIVIVSYPDVYAAPTATTGSPTVSTSGSGSIVFDGSGDYVRYPTSTNYAFGTGDFTVEAFIYRSNLDGMIVDARSGALSQTWCLYLSGANLGWINGSGNPSTSTTVAGTTWTHVAACRSGTTFKLFINGVAGYTGSDSVNYTTTSPFLIGINADLSSNPFSGYISNVRITKGTAVYTSDFTPPTAPLTKLTNTGLLLNTVSGAVFADSATGATTSGIGGQVAWNALSPFTVTGYKNRVYKWTSSGSITF